MVINLLMLTPAIYMLQLYDRVLSSRSLSTLLMLTIIVVVIFLTQGVLEWVRSQILIRISNRLELILNGRLFRASYKKSLLTGGQEASAQALDDLTSLRQFLAGNGLLAFFDAPWIPFYIAVMFLFHPFYGWVAIFSVISLSLIAVVNEKITHKKLSEANELSVKGRLQLNSHLKNAEVIEAMGMLEHIQKRWQQGNDKILFLQQKASAYSGALTSSSKTLRILLQSMVLGLGAYLAILQELTPGLMIAGSILLGRALAPIDLMISSWRGFILARTQYARLNALLLAIQDEKEKMSLPDPEGNLVAEQIVVLPPGTSLMVIKGISFSISAGDSIGLLGPSGAGKSTLLRALLGIWPARSGAVRLDGVDVYSWDRLHLGPHIGYLPQDIELFAGTISENIARFDEVNAEKVVSAARLAGVHEMILRFEQGYDTTIGFGGSNLSGGQRQRIGLARALYGDPRLVVLDEPNSNLDDKGELALSQALSQLKQRGVTIIVVTHRANIIEQLDKLMILNDGQIGIYGDKDEVMDYIQQQGQRKVAPAKLSSSNVVNNVGKDSVDGEHE